MENKIRYLEMIQKVISKNRHYSFVTKLFSIVMLLAFSYFGNMTLRLFNATSDANSWVYVLGGLLIFTTCSCLDAYFNQQEKLFKRKFDLARAKQEDEIDFDMNLGSEVRDKSNSYARCLFASSVTLFYGLSVVAFLFFICLMLFN